MLREIDGNYAGRNTVAIVDAADGEAAPLIPGIVRRECAPIET